jgi:hypothetical protein
MYRKSEEISTDWGKIVVKAITFPEAEVEPREWYKGS